MRSSIKRKVENMLSHEVLRDRLISYIKCNGVTQKHISKSESVIYLSSRIVKVNLDHLIQNPWTNSYCRKDIKISVSIWKCMCAHIRKY